MAFEAFLQRDDARPRWRRRLTLTISLIVHAALLAGGIAYSFWHVEEITPPTVRVTFLTSAPPPPAPPPAAPAGGKTETKKPAKVTPRPTLTALVQPKLETPKKMEPKSEQPPDDDDQENAIASNRPGGKTGEGIGSPGGNGKPGDPADGDPNSAGGRSQPPRPTGPKTLAPQLGALQKASGADPEFPAVLRRSGMVYTVLTKICVSRSGAVESVSLLKGADSLLDRNVVGAVKAWRYHPLLADNNAIPFCYVGRFEFKAN